MNDAKGLLEYILTSICDDPSGFRIETKLDEKGVLLTVFVKESEAGRVIGKKGATAQSIRTLLRRLGGKNNAAYSVKVEVSNEF